MKKHIKHLVCLTITFIVFLSCNKTPNGDKKTASDSIRSVTEGHPVSETPKAGETKNKADDLKRFIPENYAILDTTSGDLNLDGSNDLLLVLKKNGEDTLSDPVFKPEKRPLLILIRNSSGELTLARKNNNTVFCVNCGGVMGDPYTGITIKDGYFTVEHHGGSATRWIRFVTYKYSQEDKEWYLHKDVTESYHTSNPEKKESFIKTSKELGKIKFENYDIYEDE